MDLQAIVEALCTAAETVQDVRSQSFVSPTVEPGPVGIVVIAPAAEMVAFATFDGAQNLAFTAYFLTSNASDRSAQERVRLYAPQLRTALTLNKTSLWDYVEPGPIQGVGEYAFGSGENVITYFGCTIALSVAVP